MLKNDDIFLVSFPKSGNSWFRFIWVNIISINHFEGEIVDFNKLNTKYIAEYDSNRYSNYDNYILPRLVKSHKEFKKLENFKNKKIYLYRHPADVVISLFYYKKGLGYINEFTNDFLKNNLKQWIKYHEEWMKSSEIKLSYENLKKDTYKEIDCIFSKLEIKLKKELIEKSIELSSFEKIREIENEYGIGNKRFKKDFKFTRDGRCKQWIEFYSDEQKEIFNSIIEEKFKEYMI
jgi:hypothetical protein